MGRFIGARVSDLPRGAREARRSPMNAPPWPEPSPRRKRGVRDLDEMAAAGFHAFSRAVCVGHSFGGIPVEWDVRMLLQPATPPYRAAPPPGAIGPLGGASALRWIRTPSFVLTAR